MRITRIEIRNFRSIRHLALDLEDTTVFIGPNNVGKTAILDAVRLALTRCWGESGTRFSGTDVGNAPDGSGEHDASGACITIWGEESAPEEWPQDIAEILDPIGGIEPRDGRRSLVLRCRIGRNEKSGRFESREFLDAAGKPIGEQKVAEGSFERLWPYFPVFYLGVSRGVDGTIMPKPRFWEEYLKALEIPVGLEAAAGGVLEGLYSGLREGDPHTKNIMHAIVLSNPLALNRHEGPDPFMQPDEAFAELRWMEALLNEGQRDQPWSFDQQGLATQSLSVMNLSRAFGKFLHNEMYGRKSKPVIVLEEPEAHLSPQAARLLWRPVRALAGQKIVTTHSPHFVQHVPFRDLRLVRLTENGTEVRSLPSSFSATIPHLDGLDDVVRVPKNRLRYDCASQTLTVNGVLHEKVYRALLTCCGSHGRRRELEGVLRDLRDRSSRYVDDDELRSLETFAQRIRGEIFFAECWMIVEGPSDYLIVHALAHAMRYDLDWQGVSVIDAQNNGSPQAFATLARALDIPWCAVFDGDDAGKGYIEQFRKRGFDDDILEERCRVHMDGDLEAQLVADGLGAELRKILEKLGIRDASSLTEEELLEKLRNEKTGYAVELAERIRGNRRVAERAPEAFRAAIGMLPTLKTTNTVDRKGEAAVRIPSGKMAST
ncbi:MAG: AAA family ATPase [Deltaproteobacteria bacterium]|nr:AAA family ATPase [Deltaproteobacteria bacterium]